MPRSAAKNKPVEETTDEVVVGSYLGFAQSSSLRFDGADRVEHRLNETSIERLRLDAEVESDVSILADSVFSDGISISPRITDKEDPELAQAEEIADFCRVATDTRRPLAVVGCEMFKAAFYSGVKVAEIVLKLRNDSQVNGKLVLDRVNPKPNSATAFVTDRFFNVLGLVGARDSARADAPAGKVSLSGEEIIPREKFFILDFELENNDPRGVSLVRAAFADYCDKLLTREQWKAWRKTSSIPKKFGTTGPDAKEVELKNPDGSPVLVNGIKQKVSAQKALTNALDNWENDSSVVAPYGYDVKQLEVVGTGVQFERAIRYNDSKIRKVILGDSLATAEADKDARAARESSKDVVDIRKQKFRGFVAMAIERDILRLLTIVNFGEDKAHLTPRCFLGDTEANDWATDLQAASKVGYKVAKEHLPQLDEQFGLKPRNLDAEEYDPGKSGDASAGPTGGNDNEEGGGDQ